MHLSLPPGDKAAVGAILLELRGTCLHGALPTDALAPGEHKVNHSLIKLLLNERVEVPF